MKSIFEKVRITLSIFAVVVLGVLLISTKSKWEAHNELVAEILFLLGITMAGIGSLGRLWCSLYIAGYKTSKLVQDGPYSITRNPLYVFSFIGAVGAGAATETFTFPILIAVLFFCYYPRIILSEEKRLKEIHGEEFEQYMRKVPRVFPKLSLLVEPTSYLVNPIVYRKHTFSALWFIWIVGIIELVEGLKGIGIVTSLWSIY